MSENIRSTLPRTNLSPAKQALLKQRLRGKRSTETRHTIPRRPNEGFAPVSYAQLRLWFLAQLEPHSSAYSLPLVFQLEGPLDTAALENSLAELVRRHEILRTTFPVIDGQPVQHINATAFVLPLIDLEPLSAARQKIEAERLVAEENQRPYDLSQGPLFRTNLLRLSEEKHILLISIHHIIFDEWSYDVFCRELATLYHAFSHQKSPILPDLPIQYADFAIWQRDYVEGQVLEQQLAYWQRQLEHAPPALELPFDHPRKTKPSSGRGARVPVQIDRPLCDALKAVSRQEGTTLFMTLLAAFFALLYRYSAQTDIVVGTPISNRSRPEVEPLIGLFLNAIALRTDLSGNPSFRELLAQVREVALEGYTHQDLPFEKLVDALQLERDINRSPLFQVMFILQNTTLSALELPGLSISASKFGHRTAVYDLTLFLNEGPDGLKGAFDYDPDLFEAATIERMTGHLLQMLAGIIENPEQSITVLPLLTEAERHQILFDWNKTQTPYSFNQSLIQLFEAQVDRRPDATAFCLRDQLLTFQDLNHRANQLARFLQSLGVGWGTRVGLCIERSFEAGIGLLGIFKAGGVYVPLDPAYPQARLSFMLEDAGVAVVLTHERLRQLLQPGSAKVVCLDTEAAAIEQQSPENLSQYAAPDEVAYIIYTSGSTGQPKGAVVPHRQILNRLQWMWREYPFAPDEMSCQKTALNFVDSIWELLGPLLQGSPTVIIPDEVLRDPTQLVQTLADYGVSRLWLVPSLLQVILDTTPNLQRALPQLKFWVTSGEALSVELLQKFQRLLPDSTLYNLYGTSEVWDVTWYEPDPQHQAISRVPIGRPIDNMQTYVLDAEGHPVPIGVLGELCVGGVGLAQGYLNRPELTTDNFRPNPFDLSSGARLYRTGDLVRYLPDGNLEYAGRIDHQVKLRGYRVELGEVEFVLSQHPAIHQVVVTTFGEPGDKRLTAYFIPVDGQQLAAAELRTYLKDKLPDYTRPAAYVALDRFPLTPSGKINRLLLPKPEPVTSAAVADFMPPLDDLEIQLAKLWEQVLRVTPVGLHDDFFELGGHSLLAIQLVTHIEKVFGKQLPLATLFQAPTVAQLANVVRQERWELPWSSLVPIQPYGPKPPLFIVHGGGGQVLFLKNMVRYLDPDQPLYGLQRRELSGKYTRQNSIEEMAAHYLKEIRLVQPEGPYRLGGYCIGATIAFDLAQQLQAQSQEIDLLALIGAGYPPGVKRNKNHYLQRTVHHLRHRNPLFFWPYLSRIHRRPLKKVKQNFGFKSPQAPAPDGSESVDEITMKARYKPQPFHQTITMIETSSLTFDHWSKLTTANLERHLLSGSHLTMFQEPYVRHLGEIFNACLNSRTLPGR